MKNLNKKQKIILTIIGLCIVGLLVLGATYAWFIAVVEPGEKAPVDITTDTTDNLLFDVEDNINLAINKYNFGPGNGDLTSHAKATATLRANSTDNTATYNYYLYFNIESNEFVYTTSDHKPEIILTITDPNGNQVTEVTGLTYVTAGSVSGFDITTANGLFEIANNYEITSNSSTVDTIQEWNVTATFINLDSDQNDNTGKSMNGSIIIQRYQSNPIIADVCKNDDNLSKCIVDYSNATLVGEKNIIHHNGTILDADGNIIDANDGSYRYTGGDINVSDKYKNNYSKIYDLIKVNCNGIDKNINDYCYSNTRGDYFYLVYDSNKIQYSSYYEAIAKAIEDGYIVHSMSNYVCFGSDAESCPQNNLYRIIGVFGNNVKLIKADYVNDDLLGTDGDYNSSGTIVDWGLQSYYFGKVNPANYYINHFYIDGISRSWNELDLNNVNLNKNYLNNIGEKWSNMIDFTDWYTGGYENDSIEYYPLKDMHNYEVGINSDKNSVYTAKIGLMYMSDYGYASPSNYWNPKNEFGGSVSGYDGLNNWLNLGGYERFITRDFLGGGDTYILYEGGYVASDMISGWSIRPVFYLKSNIKYVSGAGTIENPIRIGG